MKRTPNSYSKALKVMEVSKGMIRVAQAIRSGINPKTLQELVSKGRVVKLSRGLYRIADMPEMVESDICVVSAKVPNGVICLISALSFYKITTQIPQQVDVAIPKGHHKPLMEFPPIKVYRFSDRSFNEGIETHNINGVAVRIYNIPKTIADCFKFRNKIGLDVAVEALRDALKSHDIKPADILKYARVNRVEKVMMPYLEAMI